jgi:hypothetical protein
MSKRLSSGMAAITRALLTGALFVAFAAVPQVWAQTATVSGSLSAFDVVNDTGQPVHGFEIQIEGALPGDLYYTAPGQRYGQPTVVPYATGVYIRYKSSYSATTGTYTATTPMHTPGSPFSWNDCYQLGSTYATSGCEHFGQSLRPTPAGQITGVTGRWMIDDPANPGNLIALNPPAAIPFATWSIAASTVSFAAPVVVAQIEPPEPPETPEVYGDAQWAKVYVAQYPFEVTGDQLTSDNTNVVPEDATKLEVAWEIVQKSPPSNGNQKQTRNRNQGGIAASTRSIVRRYELYKYTGVYDATTHQAICADGTCTAPSAGELGGPLSAQNTAVNVTADSFAIAKSGNGGVSDSGKVISCGSACATFAPNGTILSLTAAPASGVIFAGWGGACSGNQLTCSVTVNGQVSASATFKSQFTLSIGHSNPGTVTGTPAGNDRAIDCGGTCSAKFTEGTAITLTATPPAGKTFVNWSGGCSGIAPTCTLTIGKDTAVQAVFSK